MAQPVVVGGRATSSTLLVGPVVGLVVLAVLAVAADLLVGTGAWFFGVAGLLLFAGVVARPELGIAVFLSTFLIQYPPALQGVGFLTINNTLGMVFLVLMAQRVSATGDGWFLRNPELRLLVFIALCYFVSGYLNGPEPRLAELIGLDALQHDSARLFINRVAYVLFFVNFIKKPAHIRLVYLVAITLMVYTVASGTWDALHGGGWGGYRAASSGAGTISSAGNPNRLALMAIIATGALWYASQQIRSWLLRGAIFGVILVQILAVFMTASRSGLLGLLTCVGFIAIDEGVSFRRMFVMGLVGIGAMSLVLWFVPEKSLERLSNLPGTESASEGVGSGSLERRAYTFEIGEQIIKENFFLGVGVGNWEITRYMTDPTHATAAAHSSVLLAWTEGGVFCVLAFAALFWRTWRNLSEAQRLLPRSDGIRGIGWILKGVRVGVLALAVFSLVADLWTNIVFFWLVGLGVVLLRYADERAAAAT